jgi:transposase
MNPICKAVKENTIPSTRFHADTTTISFYGEYDYDESMIDLTEEEREDILKIERGYNKDGRPQCNQVVVGQIVNEVGVPLVSKTLNGSTSDVTWNKEAVKYFEQLQNSGFEKGILVADSKLVTEELIRTMNDPEKQIRFVFARNLRVK